MVDRDRDEFTDDELDDIGPIPNPLQQTFDRRFVQQKSRGIQGFGTPATTANGGPNSKRRNGPQNGPREPDPMQTSVGYIGADAFFRKGGRGGGGGGGGGNRGGGGYGGGGGGGNFGGGGGRRGGGR